MRKLEDSRPCGWSMVKIRPMTLPPITSFLAIGTLFVASCVSCEHTTKPVSFPRAHSASKSQIVSRDDVIESAPLTQQEQHYYRSGAKSQGMAESSFPLASDGGLIIPVNTQTRNQLRIQARRSAALPRVVVRQLPKSWRAR